ncbi:MAG: HD domain-containing phosphohydrolase [Candidatus Xenobia bacterium]
MTRSTKTILLADDEPLIRHLTRKTLAGQNLQILEAENGFEALLLARQHHPDLIVLDIRMPGKSGIEVCRTLRQEAATRATPIILLAGDVGMEDMEAGVQAGANHFFTKPFSPLELISKIQEFLSRDSPPPPLSHGSMVSESEHALDGHRAQSEEELGQMRVDQLLLYAADLSKVYREEQQKREELKDAYERLREMEKMKDIFISLVSHELRTPLSIIKGYLSLMDQMLTATEGMAEMQKFTGSIQRAASRLEDLIKELLDFSKMKHGVVPVERKDIDLPSLLGAVLQEMAGAVAARDLTTEVQAVTVPPIVADPGRLRDALTHVLKNAIAFNVPGGRIAVQFEQDGPWVRVLISDTGVGIPTSEQEKIFVPFYQVEDYLTRSVEGLGLGLSIARHIVEDHGGSIAVESQQGKGSTFTLSFPCKPSEAEAPPKPVELSLASGERQLLAYAQELSELYSQESVRAQRLEESLHEMERTYLQTIAQFAKMVDLKDAYSVGHTDRVSFVARSIAASLNSALLEDRNFTLALLLHDLGKIGVAEDLLQKAEKLTDEEWAIVRSHVEIGTRMLEDIQFLSPAVASVRAHHERWDGRGYPDGLRGEEIPVTARIIAVADAFEALTSDRPYRKGLSLDDARREIHRNAGSQFDPRVVEAFMTAWGKISRFREATDDADES